MLGELQGVSKHQLVNQALYDQLVYGMSSCE